MPNKIITYFPIILLIFHVIGLFIFIQAPSAANLTWFNLTLCGVLVFLNEKGGWSKIITLSVIFIGGFLIELIGTKTGWLFGEYNYGTVLGFRIAGVSLIIGVNWYAIVVAASNVVRRLSLPFLVQALLVGVLCVLMDVIIEPVAIKYDFWTWVGDEIPMYNYVTWYVFSVIFAYIYLKLSAAYNATAKWLYFIWLGFFLILSLV
jgi:putative membrane protein